MSTGEDVSVANFVSDKITGDAIFVNLKRQQESRLGGHFGLYTISRSSVDVFVFHRREFGEGEISSVNSSDAKKIASTVLELARQYAPNGVHVNVYCIVDGQDVLFVSGVSASKINRIDVENKGWSAESRRVTEAHESHRP